MEKDPEAIRVLNGIRVAIAGLEPGRAAGLLLIAMIEIANKEGWSSSRLLAWFCEALMMVEKLFKYKDVEKGPTLQ